MNVIEIYINKPVSICFTIHCLHTYIFIYYDIQYEQINVVIKIFLFIVITTYYRNFIFEITHFCKCCNKI